MKVKFLSACLVVLGGMTAFASPPRVPGRVDPNDPRLYPRVADPNDPEKTRPTISREKREQLGLIPHTWAGVVHPNVYATLDRLNRTVTTLKDRLKTGRDVQAFQALWSMRFKGMVYVQVQVKDKDAGRRVLASVKASEFHVRQLFEGTAGFVGYATKEGLDKLAKNPDVLGVCLDDKPLPGPGKIIVKDILPPAKPGETASAQPGVAEGKVDPHVYRAFDLADRVHVMVGLRGESLPELTDKGPEMRSRLELRNQAEKQLQDRVLSTVSAHDFWVEGRGGPAMHGAITKEGLQELWKHPDVRRIVLPQPLKIPAQNLRWRGAYRTK